jgi:transposase
LVGLLADDDEMGKQNSEVGRRIRVQRPAAEKRRIVELTFQPGASVARVAQAEGVNANQVFHWRRAYLNGELAEGCGHAAALLPVKMATVSFEACVEQPVPICQKQTARSGAIHIDLPGRAAISVECGADAVLLRTILTTLASNDRLQGNPALESLRK